MRIAHVIEKNIDCHDQRARVIHLGDEVGTFHMGFFWAPPQVEIPDVFDALGFLECVELGR